MAAAAIMMNQKQPYLGRGLTDADEIWHDDAVRPLDRPDALKI